MPRPACFSEHYGIRVAYLGEDGDMIALGHHDSRRVVAAFNRHARHHSCWLNMADDTEATYADVINALQATYVTEDLVCGSCNDDDDDDCTTCRTSHDRRFSVDGWDLSFGVSKPGPGVFPVTVLPVAHVGCQSRVGALS
jgi:hypothetical protein